MSTCEKCGAEKQMYGGEVRCKACRREWRRAYDTKHPEKKREWNRRYYAKNRERVLEGANRYCAEHPEKKREIGRRYYAKNWERVRENERKSRSRARRELSDSYVRATLRQTTGLPSKEIPDFMITVWREAMRARRLMKQLNQKKK